MKLESMRSKIYGFFDEKIKPLILEDFNKDDIIDSCYAVANSYPDGLNVKWVVKKYGKTIRVSAKCSGFGYMFFMIATPNHYDEYDFGVKYYGSRG